MPGTLERCAKSFEFLHWQRVHVGAQPDGGAAAALQRPHHAGLGEALVHVDAPAAQALGDESGGAVLLERGLRMRVEVAPPRRHLVMEGCDAVDDMHGG